MYYSKCPSLSTSSFYGSTTIKGFVKTKSNGAVKITVSSLVVASLLAFGIFSQLVPERTDQITADTTPLYVTPEDVSGNPSFTSPTNGNYQRGSASVKTATTEWEEGDVYPYDSGVVGNPLVYTTIGKLVNEREPLEFTLWATDADGDQLVYTASNLPEGASFDANTQTFSWTPRYDQEGTYTVHFEVSDGELTDSEDVTITVVQLYEDWDVNGDGTTNVLDMVLVGQHWGETGLTGWIREDANEDGTINVLDMIVIGQHWTG